MRSDFRVPRAVVGVGSQERRPGPLEREEASAGV